MILEISSTNVTQNWFHKRYSKLIPHMLLKIGSTNVVQIGSTNVSGNRPTNVDLQTLLKIGSTSVTRNRPTNVSQN